jgi:hypothetical protein
MRETIDGSGPTGRPGGFRRQRYSPDGRIARIPGERILDESRKRNEVFFDAESDKLDRWADDLKENLERELKNLEVEIREAKKAKRMAQDLESKIAAQKRINELEQQRNHKKRTLFDAQDDIEQKKDT